MSSAGLADVKEHVNGAAATPLSSAAAIGVVLDSAPLYELTRLPRPLNGLIAQYAASHSQSLCASPSRALSFVTVVISTLTPPMAPGTNRTGAPVPVWPPRLRVGGRHRRKGPYRY
jgi:hypothetical protein